MTDRRYSVALIPGDGIGREVMPEAVRVLETVLTLPGAPLTPDMGGRSTTAEPGTAIAKSL